MIGHKPRMLRGIALGLAGLALLIGLSSVSRPGDRVTGCPQGCAAPPTNPPAELRLLSLNMLHGHPDFADLPARLELIASEIQRLQVDIVALQETPWRREGGYAAENLARQLGLNYLYLRANGNRSLIGFEEGLAILSRYPLSQPVFAVLQPKAGFFENRVVLGAIAETPWGPLELFVTHLTNGAPQTNYAQARALRQFVAGQASDFAIVAGDFNAPSTSPQIQLLAASWQDAFRLAHPNALGLTCCLDERQAAPGERLEKRIDYLFLSPGSQPAFRLESIQVILGQPLPVPSGWQAASDHAGLLLVLSPNTPATSPQSIR